MNRTIYLTLMLMILGLSLGCNFSVSTANISAATLSKDEGGTQPTTTFAPEDVFYLVVEVANAPDDTIIRTSWTAVQVEGFEENIFIDEAELTGGSDTYSFNLDNGAEVWPNGSYKVDIYLNEDLDRTLTFAVQ